MRSIVKGLVVCGIAACFHAAGAQGAPATGGAPAEPYTKGACKADAEKLCKDVQPGEGRMLECLKQHQAELSPACTTNVKHAKASLQQLSNACEPDVERFCFDAPVGKGGMAKCLRSHSSELSPDCKGALSKVKARAKH